MSLRRVAVHLSAQGLPADNFNRADAASLGTSSSGHVWDEHGTAWSIVGNQCRPPAVAAYDFATLDAGKADVTVTVTVDPRGNGRDMGPVARVVDTNNLVFFDCTWVTDHWVCRAFERVGGSFTGLTALVDPVTVLGSDQTTPFSMVLTVSGSSGSVSINSASQGTWSSLDPSLLSATKHGLGGNNAFDAAFDNLVMT